MFIQRRWLAVVLCCAVAMALTLPVGSGVQASQLTPSPPDGPYPSAQDSTTVGNLEID